MAHTSFSIYFKLAVFRYVGVAVFVPMDECNGRIPLSGHNQASIRIYIMLYRRCNAHIHTHTSQCIDFHLQKVSDLHNIMSMVQCFVPLSRKACCTVS